MSRPFVHLDYTFQDKVSKAVIEARQKNQNIMIKIMYMNNKCWKGATSTF
jgi:hypothetical protein